MDASNPVDPPAFDRIEPRVTPEKYRGDTLSPVNLWQRSRLYPDRPIGLKVARESAIV